MRLLNPAGSRTQSLTEKEVTWPGIDFNPLASMVFQPFHPRIGETVPLGGPGRKVALVSAIEFNFKVCLRFKLTKRGFSARP
jgi:hypothetical protein